MNRLLLTTDKGALKMTKRERRTFTYEKKTDDSTLLKRKNTK